MENNEWHESIGAAIESAAEALPDGYSLRVVVERHGYSVRLITPDETVCDIDGENLVDEIEALIELAVKHIEKHA